MEKTHPGAVQGCHRGWEVEGTEGTVLARLLPKQVPPDTGLDGLWSQNNRAAVEERGQSS